MRVLQNVQNDIKDFASAAFKLNVTSSIGMKTGKYHHCHNQLHQKDKVSSHF